MADEFKHLSAGTTLTQGEYEAVGGHVFACQATGDIVYASSGSQLSRLGKGAANTILAMGGSCIPAWTNTPSLNALTVDDVNIDGKVVTLTGSACDTIVMTAAANGAFSLVTTDTAAAAANITITADGTVEIDSTGTLTLDASTDIVLDADGDNITFKAGSGDSTGLDFSNSSGTWTIKPGTANADLIFNVNDGCVDTKVMAIDAGDSVVTFGGNSVKSGEIRILEDTDSGANYTAFKVGNMAANVTYTLPTNVAASCGLFLKSTCAGVLSWAAAGGGCVACDSSPQLGGNLDVVTHNIVSTCNRDINIIPHGTGSIALNDCGVSAHLVNVGGSFTGTSDGSSGFSINPAITGAVDGSTYVARIKGTIVEAGSGTHPIAIGLAVETPTITNAGAGTTTAATFWVQGAPSGATTNYAAYIDGGTSRFDGPIINEGIVKAWGMLEQSGTHSFGASFNMDASITDGGTGLSTVSFTTDFSNTEYAVVTTRCNGVTTVNSRATGTVRLDSRDYSGNGEDTTQLYFAAFGT